MAAMTTEVQGLGVEGASFHITPAAVLLLLLNLMDGVFTLTFLQLNVAEELNPLMRVAYEHSPMSFMAIKLVVVSLGLSLLCLHRSMNLSQRAIQAGAALYVVIDIYHFAFLTHLWQRSVY